MAVGIGLTRLDDNFRTACWLLPPWVSPMVGELFGRRCRKLDCGQRPSFGYPARLIVKAAGSDYYTVSPVEECAGGEKRTLVGRILYWYFSGARRKRAGGEVEAFGGFWE